MKINHSPLFDTKRVEELYTHKDGVPVTYVCTSAIGGEAQAMDIFFRETPHSEFGNRYFGLYRNQHFASDGTVMIANADKIEDAEFGMVEGSAGWEYSQHRHDLRYVGACAIDGGRAYIRRVGDLSVPVKYFVVKDGKFVDKTMSDDRRSLNSLVDIEFAVARIEELEAKLAKAVTALEFYGGWSDSSGGICGFDGGSLARTTIEELSSTTK